jgi:hypothetical protein
MAVSMAAALAASLPTPVMPTPSRSNTSTGGEKLEKVKDMVIPNELKSGLDVEAKVEVESVELDGMVSRLLYFRRWYQGGSRERKAKAEGGKEGRTDEPDSVELPRRSMVIWNGSKLLVSRAACFKTSCCCCCL